MAPIFCSLGMFIIDDNEYSPSWNRPNEYNIIGGAGPYAVIGARIAAGPALGDGITGIIDKGSDFPDSVNAELRSWRTGLVFRDDPDRKTTRGMNSYDDAGVRTFTYLNPKRRIVEEDIVNDPELLSSRCFHLICSMERCEDLIDAISAACSHEPVFIYEPLPSDCVASKLEVLKKMIHKVDIFTPNLNEAAEFFGMALPSEIDKISQLSDIYKSYLTKPGSGVVLRCGPLGCYINSDSAKVHLPAYHQDQKNVVDVTGGGNSFCGGFMAGLYLSKSWTIGGICGNLASGCIIEHLGMPVLGDESGSETWNRKTTTDRLVHYLNANPQINVDRQQLSWLK